MKVQGVSRDADNSRSLVISLSDVPSDDDLRSLHEHLRGWRGSPTASSVCPHCRLFFPTGGTCRFGGCPMGGDF